MIKRSCLLILLGATMAAAAPIDDLASPDQATRDAAAKILRVTYKPPPRAKWEPLLASLKPGMNKPAFADQLAPHHISFQYHSGHGLGTIIAQLDDGWLLCAFFDDRSQPPVLTQVTLSANIKGFWLGPPPTFSGTWTTYYANGQKLIEGQYRKGRLPGTLIGYRSDGSLNWLGRYDATGCTDENYYYPSGRLKTRTLHTAKSDYITYYRENGSIANTAIGPNNGQPHLELSHP